MRNSGHKNILFLQFFGILLVVIGHSGFSGQAGWYTNLWTWIYTFHMPMFFSVSGYLWALGIEKKGEQQFGKTITGKAKRLLLPYLAIGLIVYPVKIILAEFTYRTPEVNFPEIVNSFIYPWRHPIVFFWFLPVLYLVFQISGVLLNKKRSHTWTAIVFAFSLAASIWVNWGNLYNKIDDIFGLMTLAEHFVYFVTGYIFFWITRSGKLNFSNSGKVFAVIISLAIFIAIFLFQFEPFFFEMRKVFAFSGIIASYLLAYSMQSFTKYGIVAKIGLYSYQVYLLSWFAQVAVRVIFYDKNIFGTPFEIGFILSVVLGTGLPVLAAVLVNKYIPKVKSVIGL